jgi:CRISPR-associated endonuclease/helicase Cas3
MTSMSEQTSFDTQFHALTGRPPLRWQSRLYEKHFLTGAFPSEIDLPTGMGKSMVLALWLLARAANRHLPRRLVYVVDRRTVVDQASLLAQEFAFLLAPGWDADEAAKYPEWAKRKREHEEVFASLRKSLGLETGTLPVSTLRGQLADNREWTYDASKPAMIVGTVDLIGSSLLFSGYRSSYKRRPLEAGLLGQDSLLVLDEAHLSKPFDRLVTSIERLQQDHGNPMRVIRMSATATGRSAMPFRLEADDHESDPIVAERFHAKKTLLIRTTSGSIVDEMSSSADQIVKDSPGARTVIFVQTPKLVEDVRKTLIKKNKIAESKIATLTGTMRGLERDELFSPVGEDAADTDQVTAQSRVMQRFLSPENNASQGECFLVSTSAGEVGFDLNADQMICDATTMDSMIQRLGRVNRRGHGHAMVHLILPMEPSDKRDIDRAIQEASKLLADSMDVSPASIAELKRSITEEQLTIASTPEPTMMELTDILLDAWSMTSITAPMPGRPDVGPWIRGIADELPQTTIAWREELDLDGFAELALDEVQEWFDVHRVLTHETLTVPTHVIAKWFTDRWSNLSKEEQVATGARLAIVDRGGLRRVPFGELIEQLNRKNTSLISHADLIVPASFGGIERFKGVLDPEAPEGKKGVNEQRISADVADERGRYREKIVRSEEIDSERKSTPIGTGTPLQKSSRFVLTLEASDEKRVQIVSHVPTREKLEYGSEPQTLEQHVSLVCECLGQALSRLNVTDAIRNAAQRAAEYHDHGKNREHWQRLLILPKNYQHPGVPMGKSGGEMKRDRRGYRHEFGSLCDFTDALRETLPADVFDLAMHMIAVHHGRGRPHFEKGAFDPIAEDRSESIHTDAILRFARLQRQYGWWNLAWMENLLRCADAAASAASESATVAFGKEPPHE